MAERCPFDLAKVNSEHDAAAAYEAHRADGSVVYAEAYGGYLAVIGYDAVRSCAGDPARLISGEGATIPVLGAVRAIPTEMDPPAHRSFRKLLQGPLRPEPVKAWSERIAVVTDQVIDEFIERGTADLRRIAEVVPPAIMAEILGTPDEASAMVEMTDQLNRAAGSGDLEQKATARARFAAYVDGLVNRARSEEGRTDLLASIVRGDVDGEPVSHETAVRITVSLVVAGQETTVNGIGSLLWLLGAHQDAKQRLLDDPSLVPRAVEEALRLESPIAMMGRTAAEDLEIDGVAVGKGEKVGLVFGAANLDPSRFPDPARFDLDRSSPSHLAFGHGIHRCVGEHLARAEMQIALERVLARLPDYRLVDHVPIGSNVAFNRGPLAVPVRFTPGRLSRVPDAAGAGG